jgi:uncharacterized protein (TIGR02594 family)
MTAIPAAYQWLAARSLAPLPLMIKFALEELGTVEAAGAANNPKILGWAKECGLASTYGSDAIPWCGLFMAVIAKRANKQFPASPLWALSWAKFGEEADRPHLGDVLVFKRDGGGHVGLYVGEDARAFHVLGGNQSDKVCFTRIGRDRLYAVRRPIYHVAPHSARPFTLSATGEVSRNEA